MTDEFDWECECEVCIMYENQALKKEDNMMTNRNSESKPFSKVLEAEEAIAKKMESVSDYKLIKMYEVYDAGVDSRDFTHIYYTYNKPTPEALNKYLSYRTIDAIVLSNGEKFVLKQANSIQTQEEEKAYRENREKIALQAQGKLTKEELKALKEKILGLYR